MHTIIKIAVVSVLALFLASPNAFAEKIITTCGPSEGHDYWVNNDVLKVGGWKKEEIPNGKITLIQIGTDFDIEILDATGNKKKVGSQGAVIPVENSENNVTLVVNYPGAGTEVYSFTLNEKKDGELIWTKIRHHFLIRNGGVYKSICSG